VRGLFDDWRSRSCRWHILETVVIAMCILKPALLANVCISLLRHLGWVRPVSAPSTMMRCADISNLTSKQGQVVYHFAIGYRPDSRISASNDPQESHGRHSPAWRQSFQRSPSIAGSRRCTSADVCRYWSLNVRSPRCREASHGPRKGLPRGMTLRGTARTVKYNLADIGD